MTYFFGLLMVALSIYLIKAGIVYEDKEAAGYLTKIKLIGGGFLLLIGGIALIFNPNI